MKLRTLLLAAGAALLGAAGCATTPDETAKPGTNEQPLAQPAAPGDGPATPAPACPGFVDEDGDGVCDLRASGACAGGCGKFVDDNGDGVCDLAGKGGCGKFVDENGDGVCDHAGKGCGMMGGSGECPHRGGMMGGSGECPHKGGMMGGGETPHEGCGMGQGFVDANGDGVCDRAAEGGCMHRRGAVAP
ncbi:MAG: hypothetical protein IT373_26825 [Polyangiaceae bacterium]|nr:hypothetical protein [Polyangiaceae bacterium]